MKKKNILLILILLLGGVFISNSQEQINFEYDASGNLIEKYKTIVVRSSIKSNQIDEDSEIDFYEDNVGSHQVIIYPNPTKGIIQIEIIGLNDKKLIDVILTDMNGKLLISKKTYENVFYMDLTTYQIGTYLLILNIEHLQNSEWKIIKE